MTVKYILIAMAVSALITFALRALPFIIFHGERNMPEVLTKLGKMLPATIMAVLIVYCLKGAVAAPISSGVPSLIGVLATGISYKWKHNTFLSILLGTACYMAALRLILV